MCGIFGWNFKPGHKIPAGQREVLSSTLAVANSLRGDQSWGIYLAGQGSRKPFTRREVGDIADVPGIASFAAFPVAMAHTRYATTGVISKENQHPFRVGNILLAHNGMIFNHEELNRKYSRACSVDSQHFAHHLENSLSVKDIEAYGALEWIEMDRPEVVYISRLRNGTLHAAGIRNYKGKTVGVVWSSDKAHLDSALGAARLDSYPYEPLKEGEVYEINRGKMYLTKRECLEVAKDSLSPTERKWMNWRTSGARGGYMTGRTASPSYGARDVDYFGDGGADTYTGSSFDEPSPFAGGSRDHTLFIDPEDDPTVREYMATHGLRIVDAGIITDREGNLIEWEDVLKRIDDEEAAYETAADMAAALGRDDARDHKHSPAWGGKE